MNTIIVGCSVGFADVSRRAFDAYGPANASSFFVFLAVVMSGMFGLHTLFYITLGWGGGMLANKPAIEAASFDYFFYGAEGRRPRQRPTKAILTDDCL